MTFTGILSYYWNLIKTSRKWLYFTAGVFILAAVAGFVDFYYQPHLIETILGFFKDLLDKNQGGNEGLVWIIFKQNLTTSLVALIGGVLLAVIPIFIVLANGFIIGYVIHFLFRILPSSFGLKLLVIVVTLLPHGIFELPIVLLSAALGIKWGSRWMLNSSKGMRGRVWKDDAKQALLFIPLLIIILVIAAYIEVYVSGQLAALFAGKLN